MAIPAQDQTYCRMEYDHLAQFSEAACAVTITPAFGALYYLIPFAGAWVNWHQALRPHDRLQLTTISEEAKQAAIAKVEQLKIAAGITRNIALYTSDNYMCSSFGGTCSITDPIISIPRGFLAECGPSTFEPVPIAPAAPHWKFTADEVLFFIARELANIKSNDGLIRLATKIFFFAAIFFVFSAGLYWAISVGILLAAAALHLIVERCLRASLDTSAVDILAIHFQDQNRASQAAQTALQKLIDQNIERRETNTLCRFYITRSGNNPLLDPNNPCLTSRLARVQAHH